MPKNIVSLALGVFMLVCALSALATGETLGIGGKHSISRYITREENPIEFIVVVIINFAISYWLLRDFIRQDP
ncbi:hypothetical protein [Motiliproteus coralliicola]|uniref:hypothetical protein n=1 Tax=Motiliproteus coralliicola TaxID=2283196 RepID=UPI0014036E58|nr:hypothetical protein [Motiliproteus coralliicola]